MSAFIVSRNHILYLVRAASDLPGRNCRGGFLSWNFGQPGVTLAGSSSLKAGDFDEAARIANTLALENVRSVNTRYSDGPPETQERAALTFTANDCPAIRGPVCPVQTLKAIASLEYQSSETDDWEETEACAFLRALRSCAISCLPGYTAAEWAIR